ncbi:MAG: hypothetical protein U5L03_10430 [Burkholderiaceae bacterium]|nr:hypothetical protein [Burkholderiaceae bacterium]
MKHLLGCDASNSSLRAIVGRSAARSTRTGQPALAICAALFLVACGSSDAPEPPADLAAAGERVTTAACSIFNPQDCTLPPPVISGLTDATVGVGQGVVFSALTSGSAPLAHQWSRRAAGSQTFVILSATAPSYTVPAATLANNGDVYRLRVTDRFGAVSLKEVTLRVVQGGWAPLSGRSLLRGAAGSLQQPSLAVCAVPSVAALRRSGSRDVIDVLRFDGLQWVSYGSFKPATASGSAADPTLDCIRDGTTSRPLVAWTEGDANTRSLFVRVWDGAAWKDTSAGPLNLAKGTRAIKPVLRVPPYDENVGNVPVQGVTRRTSLAWIENGVPTVRRWDAGAWRSPAAGAQIPGASNATDIALKIDLEYQNQYPPVVAWLQQEGALRQPYVALHTEFVDSSGVRNGNWFNFGAPAALSSTSGVQPATGIHVATGKIGSPSGAVPIVLTANPAGDLVRSRYYDTGSYLGQIPSQIWARHADDLSVGAAPLKAMALDGNELPRLACAATGAVPQFGLALGDATGFEVRTGSCGGAAPMRWTLGTLPRHPVPVERLSLRMDGTGNAYVGGEVVTGSARDVVVWRYFP